ncbi:hypothetical protein [Vulgatibacter incomptus]|uniref:Putative lipoprotein n=1 Tax=Vulgatibacter incomptus TaxID=1391653 RepID=A0A0K1PHQ8_9BACT|nr:hypothetical protein [Vulgatibacter incomptus]AKU92936.1 putative lipoprotein [Vulgatibacter incomptus]
MRNLILVPMLLAGSLLSTGCAMGVAVRPPVETTIYVPAPPPRRAPLPPPPPPPQRGPMSRNEAISLGQSYCYDRGFDCWLDGANLAKHDSLWKVKFTARGRRSQGKLHLEFDAWSGDLVRADEKGQLRKHG